MPRLIHKCGGCPRLLGRALLGRIALSLFARGFFFLILGLLFLLLVRLVVLTGLRRGAGGAEASRESHDVYLLSCRDVCHLFTVRPIACTS